MAPPTPKKAHPKYFIRTPTDNDILCGKGKECNTSPGSQRYRLVIDSYRRRYANALTRHDKMEITLEIYELLRKTNSRFLKHNKSEKAWEEISFLVARDKIGHALRFQNRQLISENHHYLDPKNEANKKTTPKATTSVPHVAASFAQLQSLSNLPLAGGNQFLTFASQYIRETQGNSVFQPSKMSIPHAQEVATHLLCSATGDSATGPLEPNPVYACPRGKPKMTAVTPAQEVCGSSVPIEHPALMKTGPTSVQSAASPVYACPSPRGIPKMTAVTPAQEVLGSSVRIEPPAFIKTDPTSVQSADTIPPLFQLIDASDFSSNVKCHTKPDEATTKPGKVPTSSSSYSVGSCSEDSACWSIMQDPMKDWAFTEI